MQIRGLKYTHKSIRLMGGEGSGFHGHSGRPGSVGGSAPSGEGSVVTLTQRGEILRQLKARVEFLRGKVDIQWREPIKEPGQTQSIHVLATVESTSTEIRRWNVNDIPELVRHSHSIGNLTMRIGRPVRRRHEPPIVVKFDW